jgi:UDP-2,3-diacylglucosamine pyrophosphatase LpxH
MSQSLQKNKCLLLNADYSLLSLVNWQRAIVWSLSTSTSNIEILEYYNDQHILAAHGVKYPLPAVARTIKYFNIFNKTIPFSRNNLFLRDNYTCQYCGQILNFNQLTYDHVIPKSRYKNNLRKCTNWTNIVTSCVICNRKKANRTPEEAGMELINKPYEPKFSKKYLQWHQESIKIYQDKAPIHWKPFLYSNE